MTKRLTEHEKTSRFISRHIQKHQDLGMSHDQAIAVALNEARRKGYDVSPYSGVSKMESTK